MKAQPLNSKFTLSVNGQSFDFQITETPKQGVVRTFEIEVLTEGYVFGAQTGAAATSKGKGTRTMHVCGAKQLTKLNSSHLCLFAEGAEQTKKNRLILSFPFGSQYFFKNLN